jgi:NADH:ubiquinone oxidoreductase subunit E
MSAPEDGRRQHSASAPAVRSVVFVCHGPSCSERGSPALCRQLRELLNESSARRAVRVCETTCLDHCATGPNALLSHEGAIQAGLAPGSLPELIALAVSGGAMPGPGTAASDPAPGPRTSRSP